MSSKEEIGREEYIRSREVGGNRFVKGKIYMGFWVIHEGLGAPACVLFSTNGAIGCAFFALATLLFSFSFSRHWLSS